MILRPTRIALAVATASILATAGNRIEGRQGTGHAQEGDRLASAITAAALKEHVSFLASDALGGRDTPSAGLETAADYIASRFGAAGLEEAGDRGYYQTAAFESVTMPSEGLSLSIDEEAGSTKVPADHIVYVSTGRLDLERGGLFLLDPDNLPASAEQTAGRVLVLDLADVQAWTAEQRTSRAPIMKDPQAALGRLAGAALVFSRSKRDSFGGVQVREAAPEPIPPAPPLVSVNDEAFRRLVAGWKPGPLAATISLSVPAPVVVPAPLRNVAGLIRGSDPALRDTCVMVSAHYDHLGTRPDGDGDRIFNGANDNASGVSAMIEIARAVSGSGLRPRRTILFIAFFGEEKSGMGSQWYVRHPLFPLAGTVADVNLEQLGRTDDADGPHVASASITGFDYSDVSEAFVKAGQKVGVVFDARDSAKYFAKSDNIFLARAGVPAHTVNATYAFPGRHTPADEADALDYANMERLTRAVGLGVWELSTSAQAPQWRAASPEARPYREAWEKLTAAK